MLLACAAPLIANHAHDGIVDITFYLWLNISVGLYHKSNFIIALSAIGRNKFMAVLADNIARFELDVKVAALDNNGVQYERTKSFQYNPGVVLYADAVLAGEALLVLLDAINEADIIAYTVRSIFDISTGAVGAVGNVRKEAILSLRIAGSATKKADHTIYSPYDAMISGKNVVITAPVQAYLDVFETGGDFQISDGEDISTDEATRVASTRVRHVPGAKR